MNFNPIKIILIIFVASTFLSCKGQEKNEPKSTETKTLGIDKTILNLDDKIWKIFQDANDNYWFGSNGKGIYHYDGKTLSNYEINNGKEDVLLISIFQDNDGIL